MQMPMQISLDEVLSMLLARVDSLAFNDENLKTKFNILARAMYRKGLISDEDIVDSIREEHRIDLPPRPVGGARGWYSRLGPRDVAG